MTLVGAGGVGKTRVALKLAGDVLNDYPDGVFLLELAPLTEPRRGLPGFTQSQQRQNVAAFWHWYKMPPGDGTMMPPTP